MREIAVLALAVALLGAESPMHRALDPAASKAQFEVSHVFVERVTGVIAIRAGSVELQPGSLIPTAAAAVLDPASVNTGDRDRDADLRSTDFFDVATYPQWTFTSTKIVPQTATRFGMDGMLTIHGVAQPEHLDVTVSGTPAAPHYHAVARIDRHAFGMATTRLDPAIGGTVTVTLDISLAP